MNNPLDRPPDYDSATCDMCGAENVEVWITERDILHCAECILCRLNGAE